MLIQALNKPKILLCLTSIQQNLSNQINLLFMKSNRKTNMHISKFTKTTIITYRKNYPILTSKCTQESFQVSLNINFVKYMFIWRSSITSSIYRLLMPLAHKNIHQHKRKNMRRNWARNLMLTCSNVYTYLSHFLLSFYYLFFIISRLHTNISSFFFFVNMSIQSIYFSFIYYISLCISIQVIHAHMKLYLLFLRYIF